MSKEQTRDALLDTLVEIIAQTADPDQIILFGSQAQETAGTGSDYDLDAYLRASALICVPHPLVESSYWCFLDADFHDARRLKEKRSACICVNLRPTKMEPSHAHPHPRTTSPRAH
jgi:hypothetical protein